MLTLKTFYYIALSRHQIKDGTVRAYSPQLAKAQLKVKTLIIFYITPIKFTYLPKLALLQSQKKLLLLLKQILPLIDHGLTINETFKILATTYHNKAIQTNLTKIHNNLASGLSFSSALSSCPKLFSPLTVTIFSIAEKTSSLSTVLHSFVNYLQKQVDFHNDIKRILIYPIFLFIITLIIAGLLIHQVLPELALLYTNFNAQLPPLLLYLLKINTISILFFGLMIIGFFLTLRIMILVSLKCKKMYLICLGKLPLISHIQKKLYWSHCLTLTSLLLSAGIPLMESLSYVTLTLTNPFQLQELHTVLYHIKNGLQLSKALKQYSLFPIAIIQLIHVGEETGQLNNMLLEAASLMNHDIQTLLTLASQLIQPLLICFISVFIGILFLTLYWPIFNLNQFI